MKAHNSLLRSLPAILTSRISRLAVFVCLCQTSHAADSVTTSFAFTGANQSYVVPAGVTAVTVKAWGAGGGYRGGSGAFVSGQLTVTPGETLTIITGGGGTVVSTPANAFGGGGKSKNGDFGSIAGGGGGRSAIRRGATELVTAGAGGGGDSGLGGAGGLTAGGAGSSGGAGGTQSTGSAQFAGGDSNGSGSGGGGGSGFWGGIAGTSGGAGGGGSSFTSNLSSFSGEAGVTGVQFNGVAPGGASDPSYVAGVGRGGAGSGNGGNGLVVIITVSSAPVVPTVTAITPDSGSTAGGTSVTITGTDFAAGATVTIGGTAATNVSVTDATTITCTTPAGIAGTASVEVTTSGGTNTANTLYTYAVPVPTILNTDATGAAGLPGANGATGLAGGAGGDGGDALSAAADSAYQILSGNFVGGAGGNGGNGGTGGAGFMAANMAPPGPGGTGGNGGNGGNGGSAIVAASGASIIVDGGTFTGGVAGLGGQAGLGGPGGPPSPPNFNFPGPNGRSGGPGGAGQAGYSLVTNGGTITLNGTFTGGSQTLTSGTGSFTGTLKDNSESQTFTYKINSGSIILSSTPPSGATISITDVGADVVATGSGTLNLAALSVVANGTASGVIQGVRGMVLVGPNAGVTFYGGVTGPSKFGSGDYTNAASGTGNTFGPVGGGPGIYVPADYVSGTALSGTATWTGTTVAGLGLVPGSYVYSWGSGATASSLKVEIAGSAPTVTAVSPSSGSTAGGKVVTITGTNFYAGATVTIGGAAATNVIVTNATTITCTTPAGTAGPASVLVTTVSGTNSANTLFTYVTPAPIASVTEREGNVAKASGSTEDFGTMNLGSTSALKDMALTNTGDATLTVGDFRIDGTNPGDFIVTRPVHQIDNAKPDGGASVQSARTQAIDGIDLPAGDALWFSISFKPTGIGTRTAVLHIPSTDPNTSDYQINLTGLGIENSPPTVTLPKTAPVLNKVTGLYEWLVQVRNGASSTITGFDLFIGNLPTSVSVWNAVDNSSVATPAPIASTLATKGPPKPKPMVYRLHYGVPVGAGSSVTVVVEFFSKTVPMPRLQPIVYTSIVPSDDPPGKGQYGIPVQRVTKLATKGNIVQFRSVRGSRYRIWYSVPAKYANVVPGVVVLQDTGLGWLSSPAIFTAYGTVTNWMDLGAPKTIFSPLNDPKREYRVELLPPTIK